MKKEFFGFYEPTQEEINRAWENGTFVFDANSLLNLYRYSESTRKDFLLAITKLKENLFMPHQVGYEYHSNRHSVIEALNNASNTLFNSLKENHEKTIQNLLSQYLRHPSIQIESIKKIQDDFINKVSTELDNQKKNHPDFKNNDEVLAQLTDLFENKVGPAFNKEELKKIYSEGKDRYDQLVPPGYKDLDTKRKKGDQHIYGDLIIWKELISLAKKEKKEVIFITDDRKEDWWTIENGKTIRPREELIKEFYDLTGIRILIYNADNFLRYAKERKLITKIKDTTIDEIKNLRQSDEKYITVIDWLQNGSKNHWPETSLDMLKAQESFKGFEWYKKYNSLVDALKNTDPVKNSDWSTSILDRIEEFYNKINSFKTSSPSLEWARDMTELENKVELDDIKENKIITSNTSENFIDNENQNIKKPKNTVRKTKKKTKNSDDEKG